MNASVPVFLVIYAFISLILLFSIYENLPGPIKSRANNRVSIKLPSVLWYFSVLGWDLYICFNHSEGFKYAQCCCFLTFPVWTTNRLYLKCFCTYVTGKWLFSPLASPQHSGASLQLPGAFSDFFPDLSQTCIYLKFWKSGWESSGFSDSTHTKPIFPRLLFPPTTRGFLYLNQQFYNAITVCTRLLNSPFSFIKKSLDTFLTDTVYTQV